MSKEWSERIKKIKQCPCCKSKELWMFGPDLFCICGWDTTAMYVASGKMDDFARSHAEHFEAPIERTSSKVDKNVILNVFAEEAS